MKIYLVGGAVRDELLGRPILERDYVVVGSTPAQMMELGYKQVGKDFPVFLHPTSKDEHALARTERKSGKGYGGFICDFEPTITLEQDLYRRDLTVNAIAKNDQGALIDPYHGQQDIEQRILRHVSPAFREDPLRILRVARFAARYHYLGFSIADETITMMQEMVNQSELNTLTQERIWLEIEKCLGDGAIALFTDIINKLNALSDVQPLLVEWSVSEKEKLDTATKKLTREDPNYKIIQFCLWLHRTPLNRLANIEQTLKIPSRYANALRDYCEHKHVLMTFTHADSLLNTFNKIDVWRRPERLELTLMIMLAANELPAQTIKKIQHAATRARAINVQNIIAKGFNGSDIKKQLENKRITEIRNMLNN